MFLGYSKGSNFYGKERFHSIVESDGKLLISEPCSMSGSDLFDLSCQGHDSDEILFNLIKHLEFREITIEEMEQAAIQIKGITPYLRNKKLENLI